MSTIRLLFLLVLLVVSFPGRALADLGCGISRPCPVGSSVTTEADYASLPACSSDGDVAYTQDLDLYWVCNGTTGLWLPPDVQPTAVIADYTGAALPGLSVPAWTAEGGGSGSVSGGELTVNSIYRYYLTNAAIALANNVGLLARVKITTQAAAGNPFNTYMALRIGAMGGWNGIVCLTLAGQTALSNAKNVYPFTVTGDELNMTTASVDNASYHWFYILYFTNGQTIRSGSLGEGPQYGGRVAYYTTFLGTPDNTTAVFGSYTGVNVSVWDRVLLFTF